VLNKMMVKALTTGGLLAGLFQTGSAPPMKLGLWEVTTSSAMQMQGTQTMPPRVMKVRSCATADSWKKAFGGQARMRQNSDCTLTNENRTATHYSFDLSCENAKGHSEMDFGDGMTGHGTMHMVVNAGGKEMTVDTTWDSKYLGADCGSVTPTSPQIIQ
jgi:hypothetical protein